MLQKIRSKSNSLGAKILAGIICFVLAVFGFGAFNLFAVSEPAAASVNGEDITLRQLSAQIDREKRRMEELYGDDLTEETMDILIDEPNLLEQLINRKLLEQNAIDLKLVNSEREFMRQIENQSAFQVEGEFDVEQYRQVLASSGYSMQSYEQVAGLDSVVSQITDMTLQSSFLTSVEKRQAAAVQEQVRDIAYIEFNDANFHEGIEIEDVEMQAYYDFNTSEFISEETFDFEIVTLSIDTFIAEIEVTEDELLNFFQSTAEAEESNAQRRGSHILLHVGEDRTTEEAIIQLNEFKRQVMENEASFADLASEHSQDQGSAISGGDLGMAGRGVYVPEFEEALWSLNVGELSNPVESQFGVHLIKLEEIEEVEIVPLEERREDLLEQLKRERAQDPYNSAIDQLDQLTFEFPDSLDQTAETLGLEIETIAGVSRSNYEGIFSTGSVRRALFTDDVIVNRYNSKPVLVDQNSTIVGRVTSVSPAVQLEFEDVKEEIRQKLVAQEAAKKADSLIESAMAILDEEQDFGAVEALVGVTWRRQEAIKYGDYEFDFEIRKESFEKSLPEEGGRAYFRLPASDETREYLVVVSNVRLGDYEAMTEERRDELTNNLSSRLENLEMGSYLFSLRGEGSLSYQPLSDDTSSDL